MHIHVLMLCIKFELTPIKIVFFMNFLMLLKNSRTLAKFFLKWLGKKSLYLLPFLIHIPTFSNVIKL